MPDQVSSRSLGRSFLWGGLLLGLLLILGLLTRGFVGRHASAGDAAPPALVHQGERIVIPEGSPLRARIAVAEASSESVSAPLSLPGVVEADPARTAVVLPPLSGRVNELKVELGQRVHSGQVLAVIDSPDLAQAYEDDLKARTNLELATKTLARQEAQLKLGTAATRDVDQARNDRAQAAAEFARTQARLRMLDRGGSATGRGDAAAAGDVHGDGSGEHTSLLTLKAPFDGSVIALNIAAGDMINDATQAVMTIADLSTVWVTALVPEKSVGLVSAGEDADVVLSAYPQQPLHGKVLVVSDIMEADSRRNKLRIAFANPQYRLKPNMFATVIVREPPEQRVMLPTAALLMNNDRTSVFIATAPWTFERRAVDPLLEEGDTVWIREGVKPGEQVVVRGGILLND